MCVCVRVLVLKIRKGVGQDDRLYPLVRSMNGGLRDGGRLRYRRVETQPSP